MRALTCLILITMMLYHTGDCGQGSFFIPHFVTDYKSPQLQVLDNILIMQNHSLHSLAMVSFYHFEDAITDKRDTVSQMRAMHVKRKSDPKTLSLKKRKEGGSAKERGKSKPSSKEEG